MSIDVLGRLHIHVNVSRLMFSVLQFASCIELVKAELAHEGNWRIASGRLVGVAVVVLCAVARARRRVLASTVRSILDDLEVSSCDIGMLSVPQKRV